MMQKYSFTRQKQKPSAGYCLQEETTRRTMFRGLLVEHQRTNALNLCPLLFVLFALPFFELMLLPHDPQGTRQADGRINA